MPDLTAALPDLRGTLTAGTLLSELTWFRVGGPAQVLFRPADEADLAYFLKTVDRSLPVSVIGLGSNSLVRDGGVEGSSSAWRVASRIRVRTRITACASALRCPMSWSHAPPPRPVSPALHSIEAFPAASAARSG